MLIKRDLVPAFPKFLLQELLPLSPEEEYLNWGKRGYKGGGDIFIWEGMFSPGDEYLSEKEFFFPWGGLVGGGVPLQSGEKVERFY